ncbi:hypothetical protein ACU686_08185 [Yinghuangia aomiensis]
MNTAQHSPAGKTLSAARGSPHAALEIRGLRMRLPAPSGRSSTAST